MLLHSMKYEKYLEISAPGSYDVEKAEKITHQSSGAITFGIKYKDQKPEDLPGKNEKNAILTDKKWD